MAGQQVRNLPKGLPLFSLACNEAEANPSLRSDVKREMRSGAPSNSVKHNEGARKQGTGPKGSRLAHLELRFAYAYPSRAIGVGGVCVVWLWHGGMACLLLGKLTTERRHTMATSACVYQAGNFFICSALLSFACIVAAFAATPTRWPRHNCFARGHA
ncbi:hypothetical protein TRIATDRAFT_257111 [Trichoderma atroviride IMI 206040]|uniref:Uncharacterized protein n=1 Tax=Hypocrea atroviridis (strain ATCC 20476 / IMI 206040) TaxID=452589 RepID=G9NVK3_HYPAI|nr:uncharacterized protein TRIATDRAFT_299782 [Trichoderma atroviride IMI 206040]EHK45022.1 hypothetical protein TRIATDRAFT_257111 [Trichoderma atroviride IMI 206040]